MAEACRHLRTTILDLPVTPADLRQNRYRYVALCQLCGAREERVGKLIDNAWHARQAKVFIPPKEMRT